RVVPADLPVAPSEAGPREVERGAGGVFRDEGADERDGAGGAARERAEDGVRAVVEEDLRSGRRLQPGVDLPRAAAELERTTQRLHQPVVLDEGEEEAERRPGALAQDARVPVLEAAGGAAEVEVKVALHVEEPVVLDDGGVAEPERPSAPRDRALVDERRRPSHPEPFFVTARQAEEPGVVEQPRAGEDRAAGPFEHAAGADEAGRAHGQGATRAYGECRGSQRPPEDE